MYKYKDYINIPGILIREECGKYRYYLGVPFKSNEKNTKALVILKNPSKANQNQSDHTINNVLKFCEQHYGYVHIMNLFPYYSTDPDGVNDFIHSNEYARCMDKNINVLKEKITIAGEIIIAWGGNSIKNKCEYDKVINSVLEIIKKNKRATLAVRIKSSSVIRKYPWHAQVWAVNHDLETYKWQT